MIQAWKVDFVCSEKCRDHRIALSTANYLGVFYLLAQWLRRKIEQSVLYGSYLKSTSLEKEGGGLTKKVKKIDIRIKGCSPKNDVPHSNLLCFSKKTILPILWSWCVNI